MPKVPIFDGSLSSPNRVGARTTLVEPREVIINMIMITPNGSTNVGRAPTLGFTLPEGTYNHAESCYEKVRTQMVPGCRTRHQKKCFPGSAGPGVKVYAVPGTAYTFTPWKCPRDEGMDCQGK